jgi:uncharacterized membrane protein (DUF485 family)
VTTRGPADDGEADASAPAPIAPARVRVTAPRPARADSGQGATRGTGNPLGDALDGETGADSSGEASAPLDATDGDAPGATDVQGVYVRSLIRSQLRLAVICAAGFAVATALFVLAIAWTPGLDESLLAGVPVSWLLLAVGVYPLALTIAVLYVRAASRNEARYRSLAEES